MQKLLCPLVFLDTFLGLLYFTLFCAVMTTTAHSILGTDTLWFVQGQDNVFYVSKAFIITASILPFVAVFRISPGTWKPFSCNRQFQSSSDNYSLDYFSMCITLFLPTWKLFSTFLNMQLCTIIFLAISVELSAT